jgi:hypothetical protein
VSKLITAFLNAVYYQNILEQECLEKYKYMKKTLKKTYSSEIYEYQKRCKNAMNKIKCLILVKGLFTSIYLKNSKKFSPYKLNKSNIGGKTVTVSKSNYKKKEKSLVSKDIFNISNSYNNSLLRSHNEIFLPKPYYDMNITESNNKYTFILGENMIIKVHSLMIIKNITTSRRQKIKNYIAPISEFSYKVVIMSKNKIVNMTSLQIVDSEELNEEKKKNKKRSALKNKIFAFLFVSSYFILVIMVTSIYNKYENNIFKICISPLLSVVLIKFFVTQNIMIFIHTFFMFYLGEKFYSDFAKKFNPLGLVFKFVIPAISKTNHKAVLIYRKLNNN